MIREKEILAAVWDLNVSMPEGREDLQAYVFSSNGDVITVDFLGFQIYCSESVCFEDDEGFEEILIFLCSEANEILEWLPVRMSGGIK